MRTADVVGGGIAGCAAALALAKTGWAVTLYEKRDGPASEGAGIQISPNARRCIEELGLDLTPLCFLPNAIQIFGARGAKPLSNYSLGTDFKAQFGADYAVMARRSLQSALWRACEQSSSITISAGQRWPGKGNAALTVGADGVGSKVRSAMPGVAGAQSTGYIACRALLPFDRQVATAVPSEDVCLWLGRGAHAVTYPVLGPENDPLPNRSLNVVMSKKGQVSESGWSAPAHPQLISKLVSLLNPKLSALRSDISFSQWSIDAVEPSAKWVHGNTVLVGDAAHAMPPFAAQGAAMALEDAVVLAAELAKADHIEDGLCAYEHARRSRVRRLAALSHANARLYHMSGPIASARNLALKTTPQRVIDARMGWIYNWSPPRLPSD
ncbi:MAG: FAD-dependent oxidoreductase [Pseudomonadota bacterium]